MPFKCLLQLDMKKALDVVQLRLILYHLMEHTRLIKSAHENTLELVIKELENGTFLRWRARSVLGVLAKGVEPDEYPVEEWAQLIPNTE
jgi:hypothetical protein